MITIRPPQPEDADALFPLVYGTGVADTLLWDGPTSLDEYRQSMAERAAQVARGEKHVFTIVEVVSGKPVGMMDIRPRSEHRATVGIWIGLPYHGKGYGSLAIHRLLEYGFGHLGLEKIEAEIFTGNWGSRRAFEKNGFILEGTIRKSVCKRGHLLDEWVFGITREDYAAVQGRVEDRYLVHICQRTDWQAAQERGEYRTEDSVEKGGFIHCSRPGQALRVANFLFPGKPGLVLLWIDPQRLRSEIRWEPADGEAFPHIYGPINLEAVAEVTDFTPEADGKFRKLRPQ
jgi:uncharacterized protein (DUF952 family)/RimJ/RimL family protein N-acetyltransferase